MVTVQVPVPLQLPPLQPANTEPPAGVAVKVTEVPELKDFEQVAPQSTPEGLLVTVPLPVPPLDTLRVKNAVKLAVTVVSAVIVTVQLPVPLHPPPLQPVNVEPLAALAVKATEVLLAYACLQSEPQLMPVAVTVPLPEPVLLTVRRKLAVTPVP